MTSDQIILLLPQCAGMLLIAAIFYCLRLAGRKLIIRVAGFHDRESELWRCAAMMAMVSFISPSWYGIPDFFWLILLPFGALWLIARSFSHRRDFAKTATCNELFLSGVLLSLSLMYLAPMSEPLGKLQAAFWLAYAGWQVFSLLKASKITWLSLSDFLAQSALSIIAFLLLSLHLGNG